MSFDPMAAHPQFCDRCHNFCKHRTENKSRCNQCGKCKRYVMSRCRNFGSKTWLCMKCYVDEERAKWPVATLPEQSQDLEPEIVRAVEEHLEELLA